MATQILKYVRNNGTGDYLTVNAALIGQAQNLVTADKYLDIAIDKNYQETTAFVVNGYTTDATRDIHIYTTALCRNTSGKWDTSKHYFNLTLPNNTYGITISEDFVTFSGLQSKAVPSTEANVYLIGINSINAANKIIIENCWLYGYNNTTRNSGVTVADADAITVIKNCLLYNFGSNRLSVGVYVTASKFTYIYNCGVSNSFQGYRVNNIAAICYIKNSFSSAGTSDFVQTAGTLHCNYCASSDATADDFDADGISGNNHINHTFSFVDAANGDFRLLSTDAGAKGLGTDLSADAVYPFSDDICGRTRNGTWDIGPYKDLSAKHVILAKS